MPFLFPNDQSVAQLIDQLAAQSWRGAIIGPHGSGKSTLLETFKPALHAAGIRVHAITLHDRQRWLPRAFYSQALPLRTLVIIDGYEQLAWLERWNLNRSCRRANHGLLVTSHAPARFPVHLPTLIQLAPDERLVQQLVAQLSGRVSTPITPADVAASHACHGSNVRETLFDLYDRHERKRRITRTHAPARP